MKRRAIWWNQKIFLQASSAEGDVPGQKAGSDITESDDAGKDEQYEEAFSKMKKAAGKCMNFTSAIRFSDVQKHKIQIWNENQLYVNNSRQIRLDLEPHTPNIYFYCIVCLRFATTLHLSCLSKSFTSLIA